MISFSKLLLVTLKIYEGQASLNTLKKMLSVSKNTVLKAIAELENKRLIEKEKKQHGNKYKLTKNYFIKNEEIIKKILQSNLDFYEKLVLTTIALSQKNSFSVLSYNEIADRTGISRRKVIYTVQGLEEKKLIKVIRFKKHDVMNEKNHYLINELKLVVNMHYPRVNDVVADMHHPKTTKALAGAEQKEKSGENRVVADMHHPKTEGVVADMHYPMTERLVRSGLEKAVGNIDDGGVVTDMHPNNNNNNYSSSSNIENDKILQYKKIIQENLNIDISDNVANIYVQLCNDVENDVEKFTKYVEYAKNYHKCIYDVQAFIYEALKNSWDITKKQKIAANNYSYYSSSSWQTWQKRKQKKQQTLYDTYKPIRRKL